MRALLTLLLTAVLAVTAGCDSQTDTGEVAYQEPGSRAPRSGVSLYPLSTPPPGAGQPLAYANPPGQVATPFTTTYANATYSPPAYSTGYLAANTYSEPASYTGAVTTASYTTSAGYADPGFGPAGSAEVFLTPNRVAPIQTFTTAGGVCTVSETQFDSPIVPIVDPPVVIDRVYYASDPARGTTATFRASSPYSSLNMATATAPYPATPAYSQTYTAPVAYVSEPAAATTYQTTTTTQYASPYAAVSYPTTTQATYTTTATAPYAVVSQPLTTTYSSPYSQAPAAAAMTTTFAPQTASFQLVPAPDVPPGHYPNDAAPSQWYEIIRPGNAPIRIGRVSSTCVCVGIRVPKRYIEAGERALIEARTRTRPAQNNLTYGIYVNLVEPQPMVLDADITVRY